MWICFNAFDLLGKDLRVMFTWHLLMRWCWVWDTLGELITAASWTEPHRGKQDSHLCTPQVSTSFPSSLHYVCLLPKSGLIAHRSKVHTQGARAGRNRKVTLIRKPAIWGEGGLESPNQLQRFCSTIKLLKGKREVNSVTAIGGQIHCHLLLYAGLSTPRDHSLGAISFTWFAQEIIEAAAGEESWSSVN